MLAGRECLRAFLTLIRSRSSRFHRNTGLPFEQVEAETREAPAGGDDHTLGTVPGTVMSAVMVRGGIQQVGGITCGRPVIGRV